MRVFIAGASGAVGRRLVPLALGTGHQVTGMTRFEDKADGLRANGAEAVVANALDRAAVVAAVAKARSEVVVHQLTALSSFTICAGSTGNSKRPICCAPKERRI
jgi:2-alkyl-3-oxoalkanoate reductase